MISRSRQAFFSLMLPLMVAPGVLYANDGVPVLLQFAEQYRQREASEIPADKPQPTQPPVQKTTAKAGQAREPGINQPQQLMAARKALREKEIQLERQRAVTQSLQQELTALRVASTLTVPDTAPAPHDLTALSEFARSVRQALNLTPEERQVQTLIAEMREALAKQKRLAVERGQHIALLKRQLADRPKQPDGEKQRLVLQEKLAAAETLNQQRQQANEQVKAAAAAVLEQQKSEAANAMNALQQQMTQLQDKNQEQAKQVKEQAQQQAASLKRGDELQLELTRLKEQNQVQAQQVAEHQKKLAAALEENAKSARQAEQVNLRASKAEQALAAGNEAQKSLRDEIDGLRSRAKLLPENQAFNKPQGQQSYAAGVALGRDIQTLLTERKSMGIDPDKTALLAGVIDTFTGQYQLSEPLLASSLAASEKAVNAARDNAAKEQQTKGESFVSEFRKKKGTKKSPAGFWYRVDYPGDEAIAENARVDITVKETLIDGRVIQDMERNGKVLSQPLSAYPALFREAIGYLKNHGSLTMVVPPELAYGDAGYAPQVPPNATMVYELRIVDADKG